MEAVIIKHDWYNEIGVTKNERDELPRHAHFLMIAITPLHFLIGKHITTPLYTSTTTHKDSAAAC